MQPQMPPLPAMQPQMPPLPAMQPPMPPLPTMQPPMPPLPTMQPHGLAFAFKSYSLTCLIQLNQSDLIGSLLLRCEKKAKELVASNGDIQR